MIGLCLAFEQQNNYGTQLQCYATLRTVQEMGYPCEIIIYHKLHGLLDYPKEFLRLFQDDAFKGYLDARKRHKLINQDTPFGKGYRLRRSIVKQFKEKYLFPNSVTYTGFDALQKGSKKYSTVMSGSDQVWLPAGYASQFYTLMFAAEGVARVSYASSFGISEIPSYHQKQAKEFLNRMDYISVREVRGKELVEEYSNKHAKVVVDPTMLVDPVVWKNMLVPINEPDGYVFCYFLGKRREGREQAERLKKLTGLKIIILKHLEGYIPEDDGIGDEAPYEVGPEKFISYIKNATYVLTDSFHGTVFSILFKKQFITFYRNEPGEKRSKNSRIDSLLGQLGIKDRVYYKSGEIEDKVKAEIDYISVHQKLSEMREDSMKFLSESLEACEKK